MPPTYKLPVVEMFVLLLELKYELTFELLYVPVTVLKIFTPLEKLMLPF